MSFAIATISHALMVVCYCYFKVKRTKKASVEIPNGATTPARDPDPAMPVHVERGDGDGGSQSMVTRSQSIEGTGHQDESENEGDEPSFETAATKDVGDSTDTQVAVEFHIVTGLNLENKQKSLSRRKSSSRQELMNPPSEENSASVDVDEHRV